MVKKRTIFVWYVTVQRFHWVCCSYSFLVDCWSQQQFCCLSIMFLFNYTEWILLYSSHFVKLAVLLSFCFRVSMFSSFKLFLFNKNLAHVFSLRKNHIIFTKNLILNFAAQCSCDPKTHTRKQPLVHKSSPLPKQESSECFCYLIVLVWIFIKHLWGRFCWRVGAWEIHRFKGGLYSSSTIFLG